MLGSDLSFEITSGVYEISVNDVVAPKQIYSSKTLQNGQEFFENVCLVDIFQPAIFFLGVFLRIWPCFQCKKLGFASAFGFVVKFSLLFQILHP